MNKRQIKFIDLGIVPYKQAYNIQLQYLNKTKERKKQGLFTENYVLYVEHPHVYTLGKHGNSANLLLPPELLKKINAEFVQTDRGGDITYHGYGQIVAYPIFDLNNFGILIKRYIHSLEEVVIQTLADYGIHAQRLEGAPGVWLNDTNRPRPEKICAIGVRVSYGITMHGFAFNVNTDLNYFNYINPCGFTDKGVTSMEKELGHKIDMNEVKFKLNHYFLKIFGKES